MGRVVFCFITSPAGSSLIENQVYITEKAQTSATNRIPLVLEFWDVMLVSPRLKPSAGGMGPIQSLLEPGMVSLIFLSKPALRKSRLFFWI